MSCLKVKAKLWDPIGALQPNAVKKVTEITQKCCNESILRKKYVWKNSENVYCSIVYKRLSSIVYKRIVLLFTSEKGREVSEEALSARNSKGLFAYTFRTSYKLSMTKCKKAEMGPIKRKWIAENFSERMYLIFCSDYKYIVLHSLYADPWFHQKTRQNVNK